MRFVNRREELGILNRFFAGKEFQFIPVYGRRRIGKTRLIQEFMGGRPAIYFLADSVAEGEQLKNLGRQVGSFFGDHFLVERGFSGWSQLFEYLERISKERIIVVIDEFPHLVDSNKGISSIFQKGIDQNLKKTKILLILMGSSIGMMEQEVLFYKAPLYGRRTGALELREMGFDSLREFFPGKSFDELLSVYGVFGTVPAYIEKLNQRKNIFDNIRDLVLNKGTFFYNEVEYLLREELREPRNYFVILRSIAQGKRKFSEIINDTGFEKSMLSRYLEILQGLRLIGKEVPVTEKLPDKSRQGLYYIKDMFIQFWFKFVFPNRSRVEIGNNKPVMDLIRKSFDQHLSFAFEDVCKEYCIKLMTKGGMQFTSIGRWWHRNNEVDIVALDEENKGIYFGEVKWSKKAVGTNILTKLRNKASFVEWNKGRRIENFMLFSRSGFTKNLVDLAKKQKVSLISSEDIVG